jgi:hypothetical protein
MSAFEHISPQFDLENSYKVEMVPISMLKNMHGNILHKGEDHINDLAESIKNEGMREPGIMSYYHKSKTAYLGEGNHRLEALRRAGFTHMPVTVSRLNMEDEQKKGKPVRGYTEEGHVPGELAPSDIMDF